MSQPLEVSDFSGGFTDYYINGPANKYKKADNLLIIAHGQIGKLFTRPGSQIYDTTNYQIPAGNARVGYLKLYQTALFAVSSRTLYYLSTTWQTLTGPTGNQLFPSSVTTANVVSSATWNHHLFLTSDGFVKPQKVFQNASLVWQLRTAGLPFLASSPAVVGSPPGTRKHVYRFIHEYTYSVGNVSAANGSVTFLDLGPVTEVAITDGNATNAITAIPVLANGTDDNYDTTVIKIGIYRTTDGGSAFFKVGEVTNGTTTFNDSVTDADLVTRAALYTEGGVVENDPPPLAKLIHVIENVGYYAHIKEGAETRSNRLRQSVPGDIDSCPADFFVDVDDNIVGLSSARGAPVLCCDVGVYRVDGIYDELGRGGMVAQRISDTATCVSSQSVVQTLEGVFWAGADAFYFTDGFQVLKLNEDWDKTYKLWATTDDQKRRIQGKYDPVHRRIWWSIQQQSDSADCDKSVVLELNWGIRKNASFVTCSGGTDWAPTAIEFDRGDLIRGDRRGYILKHSDTLYADPHIDTAVTPTSWYTVPIIYDYISCATNFGTNMYRKFVSRIDVQCKNETNLALQIISINDDGRRTASLAPIRFESNLIWGDPNDVWGDPVSVWNAGGIIEEQRRFPSLGLRCSYKQIQMTNAYATIFNSDLLGNVNVDGAANTATLLTNFWFPDLQGYYISFENDLTKEFLVTGATGGVLSFDDPGSFAVTSSNVRFQLKGYPKNEVLHLLNYMVAYTLLGQTQSGFQAAEGGELS